ncbi:MAG: type II toxin-antitoxin system PemK/MazF family toxin [Tepidiformaceae bacterium]
MTTTPSLTPCSRGDVVFVGVRFSDGTGIKNRPVIVVSVDAVHASRDDALVVPLTTQLSMRRFGDHLLLDSAAAGLPRPSLAKGVVETVARDRFGRALGRLTDRDLAALESTLRSTLGL